MIMEASKSKVCCVGSRLETHVKIPLMLQLKSEGCLLAEFRLPRERSIFCSSQAFN